MGSKCSAEQSENTEGKQTNAVEVKAGKDEVKPSNLDTNIPDSKSGGEEVYCSKIPGYAGLNVPGKNENKEVEMEINADENVCPLIPGYYGLQVPDANDKPSGFQRDEVEECKQEITTVGRSLHWVIRNSDLKPSLPFFEKVLGLCVLRHEENDKPCDITCNGKCKTAWSKTMMGYKGREEDFAYALEVTYNYGVKEYQVGSGLEKMGIFVSDPDGAARAAKELGFNVRSNNIIVGPDAYSYQLLPMPHNRQEPFAFVALNVTDLKRSVDFYTNTIGMMLMPAKDLSFQVSKDSAVVGFSSTARCEGVPLVLTQSDDVKVEDYEGRHAIEMPEESIRRIYADLEKTNKDLIVHELRELHESLGTLVITIIKDHDGFEICLVSSETFSLLVKNGTDYKDPDFEARAQKLANL